MASRMIRVDDEDANWLTSFAGELQAHSKRKVSLSQALHILIDNLAHYEHRNRLMTILLEYVYPKQGEDWTDSAFNAGFEAGIYMALGCVEDAAHSIGNDDFKEWLEGIDDKELKDWLIERVEEFSQEAEESS